jgi:hypothetical protein
MRAIPRPGRCRLILCSWVLTAAVVPVHALTLESADDDCRGARADAIVIGTVEESRCRVLPDSRIITETRIRVTETLKGRCAAVIRVQNPGGRAGRQAEWDSGAVILNRGETRLLHLQRGGDGRIRIVDGEAGAPRLTPVASRDRRNRLVRGFAEEGRLAQMRRKYVRPLSGPELKETVTDVQWDAPADEGLMPLTNGIPCRYVACDRGDTIGVRVDMDALPPGVSTGQAMGAVSNALAAWEEASSVRFRIEGIESFGAVASSRTSNPAKLWIQTHNLYGLITSSNTLGRGGFGSAGRSEYAAGGEGGRVGTNEFFNTTRGYAVLNHTNATMANVTTMAEVLAHEVGHALGLAHSSTNSPEPDPVRTNALMYYLVHKDGRGARLEGWDREKIALPYPTTSTPPYGYARILHVVTSNTVPPGLLGVNQVLIPAYDLQSDTLSALVVTQRQSNGTWTVSGTSLLYTAKGTIGGAPIDPESSGSYDYCHIRLSDGTNLSPPVIVRVMALLPDTNPKDGLPDDWATNYWVGGLGSGGASADPDLDGYSNIEEWLHGTVPTNGLSVPLVQWVGSTGLSWTARSYALYEIESSTNLPGTFRRSGNPVTPTGSVGFAETTVSNGLRFYRSRKIP